MKGQRTYAIGCDGRKLRGAKILNFAQRRDAKAK